MQITKVAIIDIDVTLADSAHRAHFIENEPPDWTSFLQPAQVAGDGVVPHAKAALVKLAERGFRFVFLTGRNESLRAVTTQWLVESFGSLVGHFHPHYFAHERFSDNRAEYILNHPLVMRPLTNDEKPTVYKERELLKLYVRFAPDVLLAFDDDKYMFPVYDRFGAITFEAPGCWKTLFPVHEELPAETAWRR